MARSAFFFFQNALHVCARSPEEGGGWGGCTPGADGSRRNAYLQQVQKKPALPGGGKMTLSDIETSTVSLGGFLLEVKMRWKIQQWLQRGQVGGWGGG